MSIPSILRAVAVPALLSLSLSSQAALVVYTSQASFIDATSAQGVDTFDGFNIAGETASPLQRTAGEYGYTASAQLFYGAGTVANPWLSTNSATDTVLFNGFTNNVQAIGGNFFGSNISGSLMLGDLLITATDSSGSTSYTINNATTTSFLGFVSTDTLISLHVEALQWFGVPLWPTIDNLMLAQRPQEAEPTSDVPEPASLALLAAGLGLIGLRQRRRNQ